MTDGSSKTQHCSPHFGSTDRDGMVAVYAIDLFLCAPWLHNPTILFPMMQLNIAMQKAD